MIGRMIAAREEMSVRYGHYEGGLVNGARILHFWEDIGTQLAGEAGEESPFIMAFDNIEFTAPVYVGDRVEYTGWIEKTDGQEYRCRFEAWKIGKNEELCGKATGIMIGQSRVKGVKDEILCADRLGNTHGFDQRDLPKPGDIVGQVVTHAMMMSAKDVHFDDDRVSNSRMVDNWGDVGTELVIMADGDIGLFLGYKKIRFTAPVYAGDFMEYRGWLEKVGSRSYTCRFEAWKRATMGSRIGFQHGEGDISPTAATACEPMIKCGEAEGTLFIATNNQRGHQCEGFADVGHPQKIAK